MDFIPLIPRSGRRHRPISVWLSNEQRSEETRTLIFLAMCCLGFASIFERFRLTSLRIAVHILDLQNHISGPVLFTNRPFTFQVLYSSRDVFRSPSSCNIPVMRKYSYILRGPVYVLRLYAFQGNDKYAGDEWQNMVVFNLRAYFITNLWLGILGASSHLVRTSILIKYRLFHLFNWRLLALV